MVQKLEEPMYWAHMRVEHSAELVNTHVAVLSPSSSLVLPQ